MELLMTWLLEQAESKRRIRDERRALGLVPCNHFWLEVKAGNGRIIAICKYYGCRKRGEFDMAEWDRLAVDGRALNKPVRV
jgi:hypothetical protein